MKSIKIDNLEISSGSKHIKFAMKLFRPIKEGIEYSYVETTKQTGKAYVEFTMKHPHFPDEDILCKIECTEPWNNNGYYYAIAGLFGAAVSGYGYLPGVDRAFWKFSFVEKEYPVDQILFTRHGRVTYHKFDHFRMTIENENGITSVENYTQDIPKLDFADTYNVSIITDLLSADGIYYGYNDEDVLTQVDINDDITTLKGINLLDITKESISHLAKPVLFHRYSDNTEISSNITFAHTIDPVIIQQRELISVLHSTFLDTFKFNVTNKDNVRIKLLVTSDPCVHPYNPTTSSNDGVVLFLDGKEVLVKTEDQAGLFKTSDILNFDYKDGWRRIAPSECLDFVKILNQQNRTNNNWKIEGSEKGKYKYFPLRKYSSIFSGERLVYEIPSGGSGLGGVILYRNNKFTYINPSETSSMSPNRLLTSFFLVKDYIPEQQSNDIVSEESPEDNSTWYGFDVNSDKWTTVDISDIATEGTDIDLMETLTREKLQFLSDLNHLRFALSLEIIDYSKPSPSVFTNFTFKTGLEGYFRLMSSFYNFVDRKENSFTITIQKAGTYILTYQSGVSSGGTDSGIKSLTFDEATKELQLIDKADKEFNVDLSSLAGGDSGGGTGGVSEEELDKLKKQVDALYIYDSYTVPSKKWLISDEIMPFKINGSNILRLKQGNPKDNKSFKGLPVDSADSSNGIIAFYLSQEDMLYMSVTGENGAAGRLHLNSISCRIEAGFFTNIGEGKSGNLRLVSATPDADLTIDLNTGSTLLKKLYETFRKGGTVGIDYEISTDVDYITEIDCRDYPNGVYIIWDAKFKNHGRITYSVIYHDYKTSVMGSEFTDDDFYDENWKPNNIPQLEHGVEYNRDMIVRYDQKIWRVSAWKFTYYRQGFFPTDILELYPKPDVRNLPQILDYNELSTFIVQGISTHIPGFGTNITMTITAFGNSMTNGVLEDVPFGNNLSREELGNLQGSTVFTSSLQEDKYAALEIFFPHDNMQRCRISIKRTMDNAPNFGWYRYNIPFTFHFTLPPLGVK